MQKMYSNSNHTSVSWGGEVFEAEDGQFEVPEEAVNDLVSHGLIPGEVPAPVSQAPVPQLRPVPQWSNEALQAKAAELGLTLDADISRPDLIRAVAAGVAAKD